MSLFLRQGIKRIIKFYEKATDFRFVFGNIGKL